MIDRATVVAVARELGLPWDTVKAIAMDANQAIMAANIGRLKWGAGHRDLEFFGPSESQLGAAMPLVACGGPCLPPSAWT